MTRLFRIDVARFEMHRDNASKMEAIEIFTCIRFPALAAIRGIE